MNQNSWLDKLEVKFKDWTLYGLMKYISLLMIAVFILNKTGNLSYSILVLNGNALLAGQIWRIFTFLIVPISNNPIFLFFELMILIMCADGIEKAIGSFKLTVYYIMGALFMTIGSLIAPSFVIDSYFMYLSLFFGYATLYPSQELLFMFIIPIKIKYLAYFSAITTVIYALSAPWSIKIAILMSFANYLLFFAIPIMRGISYARKQNKRREAFEKEANPEREYRHKCAVCGKTEVTNPEMLFRYCTCDKCGENGVAFCPEHLKEHKSNTQGETS